VVAHSLIHRATIICQDQQDFLNEVKKIKHELVLSGYPSVSVDSIINGPTTRSRPDTDITPLGTVVIPYIKGVSEKFRQIGNRYNIPLSHVAYYLVFE
jgi:hypothetical protein